jgi:Sulfotransferase family
VAYELELMNEARREIGLDDFGDDSFREGLERLTRSVETESDLNAVGQQVMRARIVGLLSQRLQVEDWYRRHPEIDDEPVDAPLFGLGLPRTSSTALSFLLAEDPNTRSLRMWEGIAPCPPPSVVEGPDPRIERAQAQIDMQREGSPRSAALVPTTATGPYECQDLMGLDFKAQYFLAYAYLPSYSDWFLYEADLTSTYRYERRVLKLLQWGYPAQPWRLKCPTHLLFLAYLDRAFPDARFVMTHRDPAEVIVSVADVYMEIGGMLSHSVDRHYIGALNVEQWSVGMQRAIAFRDAGADHRFYDIDFRAVQRDPVGEVRGLYEWLGEPVTEDFVHGMERWWRENAQNREPNIHPDAAEFGIDLDQVHQLFADYTARMTAWTARSAVPRQSVVPHH